MPAGRHTLRSLGLAGPRRSHVRRGGRPLPNRDAKAALLTPDTAATGEAIQQAIIEATARLQMLGDDLDEAGVSAIAEALRQHANGISPDEAELAWLLVLLTHPSVCNRASGRTEPNQQHLAFWIEITRRAPEPFVLAPATLLAFTAWRFGDGMIATLAAERALNIDPANETALAILYAVNAGISAAEIERSIDDQSTASRREDDHGK
ncbi:DUF4192 domain-containing protein [Actinoplanes derwentensis]|uniref:DUF4192 domain-containing protein n=1 Tax=Actinoplanes derwentensis TaxID=113562 RepID=UPI0022B26240|nr:DUF4192 domain-containing protein [Actinoplanes derwentensis]